MVLSWVHFENILYILSVEWPSRAVPWWSFFQIFKLNLSILFVPPDFVSAVWSSKVMSFKRYSETYKKTKFEFGFYTKNHSIALRFWHFVYIHYRRYLRFISNEAESIRKTKFAFRRLRVPCRLRKFKRTNVANRSNGKSRLKHFKYTKSKSRVVCDFVCVN